MDSAILNKTGTWTCTACGKVEHGKGIPSGWIVGIFDKSAFCSHECLNAGTERAESQPIEAPVYGPKMETVYESAAQTAKRVRAVLKENFPGVKFSVRSSTYSMGSSVSVHWTDGPTTEEVNAKVGPLESAGFDGMQDLKTYCPPTIDGKIVHGADYIQCERSRSPEREVELEAIVRAKLTPEDAERELKNDRFRLLNDVELKRGWFAQE